MAYRHGVRAWKIARQYAGDTHTLPIIYNLLHNIENHTLNILKLCECLHETTTQPYLFTRLQEFYAQPTIATKKTTNQHSSIYGQLYHPKLSHIPKDSNPFSLLASFPSDEIMETSTEQDTTPITVAPNPKMSTSTETLWVNDTSVTRLSEVIINQLNIDRQNQVDAGDVTDDPQPQYEDPTFKVISPVKSIQHMRFNLIRRRDTTSDITTLKLFKSFASIMREIDNDICILPYEANKHHISPLTNVRQINAVDDNKLRLYFRSYHRKQHYSLSGYFHIGTTLSSEILFTHPKMLEWLDSHRYYIKLSPSQTEEMVQIGALLFSSVYIYRADLKISIINHPLWTPKNLGDSPVFELFTSDFIASDKKTRLIFVSAEKTKTEEVAALFSKIYDGKPKAYPNGAMMLFIPMHEDTNYTMEYRKKLVFNHDSFIGKEDAITINGLQNLNNEVLLKNGDKISIRMLLKSLPASQGMLRPQLFQFIEPNNSGVTTLATFQAQDREFIEKRKDNIENELRAIVASEDIDKLFLSNMEGIWCGGISKNKGGKIIPTKPPSHHTQQHISQITSILHSPPKKRALAMDSHNTPTTALQHHYTIPPAHFSQNQPTPPSMPTLPIALDPPLITQIDHRFLRIEETIQQHQEYNEQFHSRLLSLEKTTQSTDTKIDLILNKIESINHPPKQRKVNFSPESFDQDQDMHENHHPNSQLHNPIHGCEQQCRH